MDYVIVHKCDRLARNLDDHVAIGLAIRSAGAQMVSVSESIDDTPAGRLLHGVMASIAESYSANLFTEALLGVTEKARQCGTPTAHRSASSRPNFTEPSSARSYGRSWVRHPERCTPGSTQKINVGS